MTAYVQERFPLTRVLIADGSVPLRSGLCKLIEEEHTGWVCAEALNGRDAITKIQDLAPDIHRYPGPLHAHNGRTSNGPRNQ
jgi:hypothetical protein